MKSSLCETEILHSTMTNKKKINYHEKDPETKQKTVRRARTRGGGSGNNCNRSVITTRSKVSTTKSLENLDGKSTDNENSSVKPIFICEFCDLKFDNKENLFGHKNLNHQQSSNFGETVTNNTVVSTNRTIERLSVEERRRRLGKFTDAQIINKLLEKGAIFQCVCGMIFKEESLYFLHRACHNSTDPKKCSFCDFKANDWYDFTTHFFLHKRKPINDGTVLYNDMNQTYTHFLPIQSWPHSSSNSHEGTIMPQYSSGILPPIATISSRPQLDMQPRCTSHGP